MDDNFLSQRNKKQKDLIERINTYAENPLETSQVKAEIDFLSSIYTKEFRHDYSDFFKLVEKIYNDTGNKSIDFLQVNLDLIKGEIYASHDASDDICKAIIKLCDHINLEILRFQANFVVSKKLENESMEAKQQLSQSNTLLKEVKIELEESKKQLEDAKQKISHVQGESIAVISIFLALTLAFTGGLSYISSAISSLASASFERVVAIVLLCGLIVFNTVYVLLRVVSNMVFKNKNDVNVNSVIQFIKKHILFIVVNLILVVFLIYPFIKCFN